jgi:hypothetical protein
VASESTAVGTAAKRAGASVVKWLLILAFAAAAAYAAYTWFALSWNYSTGERAGLVQKFSKRGVLCKTYEGELAMYVVAGVQPEVWAFSVRDPAVAERLKSLVGRRAQLHYSEHPPFHRCFGDTRYYVDGIVLLDGPDPAVAPVGAPPPRP